MTAAVSDAVHIPVVASGGAGSPSTCSTFSLKVMPTPPWLRASSISQPLDRGGEEFSERARGSCSIGIAFPFGVQALACMCLHNMDMPAEACTPKSSERSHDQTTTA